MQSAHGHLGHKMLFFISKRRVYMFIYLFLYDIVLEFFFVRAALV